MPQLRHEAPAQRGSRHTVHLAELARRQHGVLSRDQLLSGGLSDSAISRWVATGRLRRVHPRVYATGHAALSVRGRLTAGLLHAGPDAAFSHTTAAWVWSLIEVEPKRLHVTVPGHRRSTAGIRVHRSRSLDVARHRDLPVTSVARTLLDLAAISSEGGLRRLLAEADFRGLLVPAEVEGVLRRGRPGSRAQRQALGKHMPQLARTASVLEERFLKLCEAARIPLPEVNVRVGRMTVDALWREARVVVELDGAAAHGGWAAIKRDRERELALRSKGLLVVRYTWEQVTSRGEDVVVDLRRTLSGEARG